VFQYIFISGSMYRWLLTERWLFVGRADKLSVLASVYKDVPVAGDHLLNADPCLYLHISV